MAARWPRAGVQWRRMGQWEGWLDRATVDASYPEGVVRRITSDIANYSTLAATRDGATLAAVQGDERAGLWVAPNGDVARARPITAMSAGRDGWSGFDWTSDGRVVYTSMTQGTGICGSRTRTADRRIN